MTLDFLTDLFDQFNLNEEEVFAIQDLLKPTQLNRNDYFLKEGHECDMVGLLIDGSMYSYTLDDNGDEIIHNFYYPPGNYLVFNFESYYQHQASNISIKCYQDCKLYLIEKKALRKLYEPFPRFYQLETTMIQQHYVQALNRVEILQCKESTDKIKMLQSSSAEIFLFFPFSYIASYLGLHRNTFTRALKKL